MNTYQSTSSLVSLYDGTSQITSRGSFLKKYSVRTKSLHDYIHETLAKTSYGSVLDVGAGDGKFIRKLAENHPSKYYAAIDIAENENLANIANINYTVYDGKILPTLGRTFDWILFMHMLYHVEHVEKFLGDNLKAYGNDRTSILITTKSKYTMPEMENLVREALNAGNTPIELSSERDEAHFCSENAYETLQRTFPGKNIVQTLIETDLRVDSGADLKNYILSTPRFAEALTKLDTAKPGTLDMVIASHLPFTDSYTEALYVIT